MPDSHLEQHVFFPNCWTLTLRTSTNPPHLEHPEQNQLEHPMCRLMDVLSVRLLETNPGSPLTNKSSFKCFCQSITLTNTCQQILFKCICCNVLACSKCKGLHSWLTTLCSYRYTYVNRSLKKTCCNVLGCSKCGGLQGYHCVHINIVMSINHYKTNIIYIYISMHPSIFHCTIQSSTASGNVCCSKSWLFHTITPCLSKLLAVAGLE